MGNIKSQPTSNVQDTISKFAHFPSDNVTLWHTTFLSTFPSGYVTQPDLLKVLIDLFPFGNPDVFSKNLFRTINISNTGTIDINELLISFSILTKGSNLEKIRWIFRFYDTDGDGVISKVELKRIYDSVYDMLGKFFDLVEINAVDDIFASAGNLSGFLTFEEFKILVEEKKYVLLSMNMY